MITFETNHMDAKVINQIASRSMGLAGRENDPWSKLDIMMDLTAVHANGCPLRLVAFRDADEFNFAHDIYGIRKHLNRATGHLDDIFCPRFAATVYADA